MGYEDKRELRVWTPTKMELISHTEPPVSGALVAPEPELRRSGILLRAHEGELEQYCKCTFSFTHSAIDERQDSSCTQMDQKH